MAKQDLVKRLANRYRRNYPYLKFSIKRVALPHYFALTGLKDGLFVIEIDKNCREDMACFIMAHEIAHCLTFHQCPPEDPHADPFWEAYKPAYKIYEKFCDEVSK